MNGSDLAAERERLAKALINLVGIKGTQSDEGERALVALGRFADLESVREFLGCNCGQWEAGLLADVVESMEGLVAYHAGVRQLLLDWVKAEAERVRSLKKTKVPRAAMHVLAKAAGSYEVQSQLLELLSADWLATLAPGVEDEAQESRHKKLAAYADEVAAIAGDALGRHLDSPLVMAGFAGLLEAEGTPEFVRHGVLNVLSGHKW